MQEQLPKSDLSRRDAKLKCESFLLDEISIWFGLLSEKKEKIISFLILSLVVLSS
jgi:hypothetical protein